MNTAPQLELDINRQINNYDDGNGNNPLAGTNISLVQDGNNLIATLNNPITLPSEGDKFRLITSSESEGKLINLYLQNIISFKLISVNIPDELALLEYCKTCNVILSRN